VCPQSGISFGSSVTKTFETYFLSHLLYVDLYVYSAFVSRRVSQQSVYGQRALSPMTRQSCLGDASHSRPPATHRLFAQQAKTRPILSAEVLEIILAFCHQLLSRQMFF
jgi:hypothetical protein